MKRLHGQVAEKTAMAISLSFFLSCALTASPIAVIDSEPEHPVRLAVGLLESVDSAQIETLDGLTAWNESGAVFLIPETSVYLRRDGGAIRLVFGDRSSGARGIHWRIHPNTSPARLSGVGYRGEFDAFLSMMSEARSPGMTVVNRVDLEEYLRGVVPGEIGLIKADHYEALKAQAVAARTYAVRNLGRWSRRGYDLLATSADQVYSGVDSETDLTDHAIQETLGEVVLFDGDPIDAFFHSTCGGATTTRREAWGTPNSPYLLAQTDRIGDSYACDASKYFSWTESYSGETLSRLASPYDSIAVTILETDAYERNRRVMVFRHSEALGDTFEVISGDTIRRSIPRAGGGWLRSTRFTTELDGSGLRIAGRGWGHGIGMCQMGAIGRARFGQNYREILGFYYPGTIVSRIDDAPIPTP